MEQSAKEISWLQLSDLHVFQEANTELILEHYKKLAKVISPNFIIISGDFRHLLYKTKYEDTTRILNEIVDVFQVHKEDVFLVPGNHDTNRFRRRKESINDIVDHIETNYAYYDKYKKGNRSLLKGFSEYKDFVKTFYKDSEVEDERITNPGETYCISWKNRINLLCINTALISDGERNHKEITDVNSIANAAKNLNRSIPTIMVGHHGLDSLYSSQKEVLENIISTYQISAYLHGDIHKYKNNQIRSVNSDLSIPEIATGKAVPQAGDDYSDVGVIYYSCHDGKNTQVKAFIWDDGQFVPYSKPPFVRNIVEHFSFSMIRDKEFNKPLAASDPSAGFRDPNVDPLAQKAYDEKTVPQLAKALLGQSNSSSGLRGIDEIANYICKCNSSFPLTIKGESGTGKSTILSLLYLKIQERLDLNLTYTEILDLRINDGQQYYAAEQTLLKTIDDFNKGIDCNDKAILFIDGLCEYNRGGEKLQEKLLNQIDAWAKKGAQFVLSIGTVSAAECPPFRCKDLGISADKQILLQPQSENDKNNSYLVKSVLKLKSLYPENGNERNARIDKFITTCKKIDGNKVLFRTVVFLADRFHFYSSQQKDLFEISNGQLFHDYYNGLINSTKKLSILAKQIASFVLSEPKELPDVAYGIPYKSAATRDYFFALHYVNTVKKKHPLNTAHILDQILSSSMNRLVVDLLRCNNEDEDAFAKRLIELFPTLSYRGKSQMVYLLGRVRAEKAKARAIKFLEEKYLAYKQQVINRTLKDDEILLFRSIGISLIYSGNNTFREHFFATLIYNKRLSTVNRLFHIAYYTFPFWKMNRDDLFEEKKICSTDNVKYLFNFLYHSIQNKQQPEKQCVNTITLIDLVIQEHYGNSDENHSDFISPAFLQLLSKQTNEGFIKDPVVKEYVINVLRHLKKENVYVKSLEELYALKDTVRAGWLEKGREVSLKRKTESVADHSWASAFIAQTFLTEDPAECALLSDADLQSGRGQYDKARIIQMLIIHDLPEAFTGDIPASRKTEEDELKEKEYNQSTAALSVFPLFEQFRQSAELWDEFNENATINARIAKDIDHLEPLFQLYFYRDSLSSENPADEMNTWINRANNQLYTEFGRSLFQFIVKEFYEEIIQNI